MNINDRLRDGDVTIAELIESLRRFPQGATVRINRGMLLVKYGNVLFTLNDKVIPENFQPGNRMG